MECLQNAEENIGKKFRLVTIFDINFGVEPLFLAKNSLSLSCQNDSLAYGKHIPELVSRTKPMISILFVVKIRHEFIMSYAFPCLFYRAVCCLCIKKLTLFITLSYFWLRLGTKVVFRTVLK